jgi:drug/metabolite transporter (DMT)-like permease
MESKLGPRAALAFACVCLFWGTTYLGIRMALESFPPAWVVALRFIISGGLLLAFALLRGHRLPPAREFWRTAFFGILILGLGNGSLAYAELLIPTGLASLCITISPFWLVGLEALLPGGERLHAPTIAGMAVGFLGTALLVTPDFQNPAGGLAILGGFAITQLGVSAWCTGSILQKRYASKASIWVSLGIQQLAGGLAFLPVALLSTPLPGHWSARSMGAVLYLVVFGSWVGYTAYIYCLSRIPIAIFSIYSYVNCVVAVLLGWLVYREHFGLREAAAMLIIFLGVGIVKWQTSMKRAAAA